MTAVPSIVRFVLCWLFIGSGVAATAAQGAPGDQPDAFVRHAVADVLSVVFADDASRQAARLDDRVLPVLRQYLDFTAVTRSAIGPAWRQLADEERQRAVDAFSTIVVRKRYGLQLLHRDIA
jgi:ABC-type transporter MlaC component